MRKTGVILAVLSALSLCACSSPDVTVARQGLDFANEVGGEYLDYVVQDTELTPTEIQIRRDRVEAQRSLMTEALRE